MERVTRLFLCFMHITHTNLASRETETSINVIVFTLTFNGKQFLYKSKFIINTQAFLLARFRVSLLITLGGS